MCVLACVCMGYVCMHVDQCLCVCGYTQICSLLLGNHLRGSSLEAGDCSDHKVARPQ